MSNLHEKRKNEILEQQEKIEKMLLAFTPLLEGVEKLCRGVDRLESDELTRKAEGLALLPELADEAIAKVGLKRLGHIGELTDPYYHEVVDTVSRSDLEPGTIVDVVQYGWELDGIPLLEAKVIVSVKK